MADIFAEDFASRTPFKNYMYLLYQTLFQMNMDKTYFEHHKDAVKNEIIYYINIKISRELIYYHDIGQCSCAGNSAQCRTGTASVC